MARLDAVACVFFALLPLVPSQFFNPLQERQLFHVGEQAMAGGSADLGRVIVRVTNGPQKEFDWQVQLYSFDLEVSNIFFFWLKEGGLENLKSATVQAMSSAYFNITDGPLPSSSSSTASLTLSTVLSTTLSTTSPTTTRNPTAADQQNTTSSNTPSGGSGGGDLPVAARAGIGVGVSVVGLTAIVCGDLWSQYLRKQQRILADLQQRAYPPPANSDAIEMWKLQTPPPAAPPYRYHPELGAGPRAGIVELG